MASIGDTLEHYGKQIVESLKAKIAEKKLVASGGLLQSLKYSVKIFGKDYVMHVGFSPEYEIVASTMDSGRKKGDKVPIQPILEWMRRKGIKSDGLRAKQKELKTRGIKLKNKVVKKAVFEKAQESMAWAIAKKIERDGLGYGKGPKEHPASYNSRYNGKPSLFWAEVINDELKTELMADLKKALKRDVIIEFGTIKKEILSHGG